MSVRLISLRQLQVTQIAAYDALPEHPDLYTIYEGFFVGFKGQTRTKLKKFRSVPHIYAYINKLDAGGWMNDDEYNKAWSMVLKLTESCGLSVYGEVIPLDFNPVPTDRTLVCSDHLDASFETLRNAEGDRVEVEVEYHTDSEGNLFWRRKGPNLFE